MQNDTRADEGTQTATFKIEGLSCSCEGQIVEKRVKALKGIKSYLLNPITFKIKVSYDPSSVTIEDIQNSVSKAGAKAVLLPTK